jgi:hypothetical protein
MKINVYFETGHCNWSYVCSFSQIYEKLLEKYPSIEFNQINSVTMRSHKNYLGPSQKYGPHFMIIENDENKKYILISYWDKLDDVINKFDATLWDVNNCVEIITSSGVHKNDIYYKPLECTYTPFSYTCPTMDNQLLIEELYKNKTKRIYPEKLTFRGYLYLFRRFLENDNRFTIYDTQKNYLTPNEYIKELDSFNLNFSINGAGEICYRDMEILGLGTTLFRTKLTTKFHNELIPDYHYVSVDFSDYEIPIIYSTHPYPGYWEELSERIIQRYEQVKDDHEYLKFVAENGRKWYLENGTIESNVDIAIKLLDFNKLI